MRIPLLSVVLPVFNGENFVGAALDCIISQSFDDFEFIIIDDGSTDKTAGILKSYTDPRIRVITQHNQGLVASLNHGIQEARGTYIVRQDADDISKPDRLAKQLSYLQENPDVVIVGSSMDVMDDGGRVIHTHRVLLDDPELRQELLIRSPFAHGSVVFKKDAAIQAGLYRQEYWPAEDYDLWLRLSAFGKLANLDEPLYVYRENTKGISSTNQSKQIARSNQVRDMAWAQKSRFISKRRIALATYRSLPDGNQRIERIMANVATVRKKAIAHRDYVFALKSTAQLALSPLAYRKTAGKLKRKIRK